MFFVFVVVVVVFFFLGGGCYLNHGTPCYTEIDYHLQGQ